MNSANELDQLTGASLPPTITDPEIAGNDLPGETAVSTTVDAAKELDLYKEKMAWLGRQIRLVKGGKEEDRKKAEGSAKQMAPLFDGPYEEEIVKFFILSGNGNGSGDGSEGKKGESGSAGQGEAKGQPSETKGEGKGEGTQSGGGRSDDQDAKAHDVTLPDGEHVVSDARQFAALGIPERSPIRAKPGSNVLMGDEECFRYIASAYGTPFVAAKFSGTVSFKTRN